MTRERAKSLTRTGQIGAVALASLAGVVFAVGIPGTGVPKIERPPPVEPMRPIETGPQQDPPQVMERRAVSIALNLAQLGNAPKPPPPVVEPGDEVGPGGETPPPPPPVPETAVTFLGLLGSSARPMALVAIDAHQQVLAIGDIIHKAGGESIKLVKVDKSAIEVEVRGVTKKIEIAPRTGAAYTTLQAAPSSPGGAPNPSAGIVPAMPSVPPGSAGRARRDEIRAPGSRRPNFPRNEDSGGGRE